MQDKHAGDGGSFILGQDGERHLVERTDHEITEEVGIKSEPIPSQAEKSIKSDKAKAEFIE